LKEIKTYQNLFKTMKGTKTNGSVMTVAKHMKGMVQSVMKKDIMTLSEELKKMGKTIDLLQKTFKEFEESIQGEVSEIKGIVSNPSSPIKPKTSTKEVITIDETDNDSESDSLIEDEDGDVTITVHPSNTDGIISSIDWTEWANGKQSFFLFDGFNDGFDKNLISDNYPDLTDSHYVVKVAGEDVSQMDFKDFLQFMDEKTGKDESFDIEFRELSDEEKDAFESYQETQLKKNRADLWAKYQLFFSDAYRKKHRRSHFRYRPDCKTCGDEAAVGILQKMVMERYRTIVIEMDKMLTLDELHKYMDKASEEKWKEIIRKVEPHTLMEKKRPVDDSDDEEIMSIVQIATSTTLPAAKKQKTLRDEFIAKGKGDENTYNTLKEKFSEDQIRAMFGL
jgi:hypothetical protein